MVFSERELKIIRIWSDTVIHGGHWGNGDVIFPDEDILLSLLEKAVADQQVSLTPRNLDILKIWSEAQSGTPEEEHLRARILDAIAAA